MYYNSQNKPGVLTLQEVEEENRKQMQEEQEKRNHDTMKSEVKKFVVYVLGLDPNTLERSEKLRRGMFKLPDALEKQSLDITDEDAGSFFSAVSFVMDILSSYDKKEEAVKCFQELESASKLTLNFDQIIDSFLKFYREELGKIVMVRGKGTEAGSELKKVLGEQNARKMVDSALGNDNKSKDENEQSELFDANIDVINTNEDKDKEDEVDALQKRYEKLSEFNDKSKYEQLDLSALNLLLLDMEKYMIDAIQGKIAEKDSSGVEKIQRVIQLHRDVNGFFLETAQSNVNKLLVDGHKSCRLLNDTINSISEKISNLGNLGEDKLTNKNEYQAKIKFLEQQINVNIRGGSLSSAQIRGLHSVISSDISNELQSVSDEFCHNNGECLAAILKIKQYRNLFVNEISKIRDSRQKMSLQAINELKKINKDLDQKLNNQKLEELKKLPKTVNVEHSMKTGFFWLWYKFLNFFTKKKQIAPQNSLNDQLGTVVHQRFNQFREKDFIVPLNSLIIRSLGIDPDIERYEIDSLFNNTFSKILSPMLDSKLNEQIGSLADALYNVIPQDQDKDLFNGVQYAISQYVGDAMIKCWVEVIFDFIRMDSNSNCGHLSRYRHKFDADKYSESLAQDERRKNQFKKILDDRFLECRSNIVTNIEQAIKNGKNDYEICEGLLKLDTELLDFCDKLHERNFDKLSNYLQECIKMMTSEEKNVRSNLQSNLKFSILNLKCKDKDNDVSKESFLNNLSPSSKKAYEQIEALAKESADALKPEKESKENMIHNQVKKLDTESLKFPNAYDALLSNTNGSKPKMGDKNKQSLLKNKQSLLNG